MLFLLPVLQYTLYVSTPFLFNILEVSDIDTCAGIYKLNWQMPKKSAATAAAGSIIFVLYNYNK
jgi:hypothetical protein